MWGVVESGACFFPRLEPAFGIWFRGRNLTGSTPRPVVGRNAQQKCIFLRWSNRIEVERVDLNALFESVRASISSCLQRRTARWGQRAPPQGASLRLLSVRGWTGRTGRAGRPSLPFPILSAKSQRREVERVGEPFWGARPAEPRPGEDAFHLSGLISSRLCVFALKPDRDRRTLRRASPLANCSVHLCSLASFPSAACDRGPAGDTFPA